MNVISPLMAWMLVYSRTSERVVLKPSKSLYLDSAYSEIQATSCSKLVHDDYGMSVKMVLYSCMANKKLSAQSSQDSTGSHTSWITASPLCVEP